MKDKINAYAIRAYGKTSVVDDMPCSRECDNPSVLMFVPYHDETMTVYLCSEHLASSADAVRVTQRNLNNWATRLMGQGHE